MLHKFNYLGAGQKPRDDMLAGSLQNSAESRRLTRRMRAWAALEIPRGISGGCGSQGLCVR